jgi:hypothetical protein
MKANQQILMAKIATVIFIVASIFTGCEKKVEVTAVLARPFAVMIPVNTNTTLSAYFEPSNATNCSMTWETGHTYVATVKQLGGDNSKALVTAHEIGETKIFGKTKEGGFTTYTTVIVNPVENENDYATLVPRFYFGSFDNYIPIGGMLPHITVKYHSKNKILFPIDERVGFYLSEEWVDCYIKVDYVADITKINNYTYNSVGEIYVSIKDKYYPASIEATFSNNKLDLIIKVKNVPEMEEILFHFEGTGSFTVGEGTGFWHC